MPRQAVQAAQFVQLFKGQQAQANHHGIQGWCVVALGGEKNVPAAIPIQRRIIQLVQVEPRNNIYGRETRPDMPGPGKGDHVKGVDAAKGRKNFRFRYRRAIKFQRPGEFAGGGGQNTIHS